MPNCRKLPMVEDLRDESDHENSVRLVLTPRSGRVDFEQCSSGDGIPISSLYSDPELLPE